MTPLAPNQRHALAWRAGTLLAVEALLLGLASLVHRGWILDGYAHGHAAVAETVLATILALGALLAILTPRAARPIAITAQAFALLGVFVGMAMIVVGVGPQSGLDVIYHVAISLCLVAGIVAVLRRPTP